MEKGIEGGRWVLGRFDEWFQLRSEVGWVEGGERCGWSRSSGVASCIPCVSRPVA